MKKLTLTIILALGSFALSAQDGCTCLPEGIVFSTQSQIDSFQINYPGCARIVGRVGIGDYYWSVNEITSLEGLNVLTSIGGNLSIRHNDLLTSLSGLENLTTVGGGYGWGASIREVIHR